MVQLLHIFHVFGAEEEAGIAALGIDPLAILAQGVTFLVLFFLLKKFALNKIVETLEKRNKTINDGIRLGQTMEAEKAELDQKVKAVLKDARLEADKIIASGHTEATEAIKQAEAAAARKVDAMLTDAKARISDEMVAAKKALTTEILSLVSEATEAVIDEKLDSSKDRQLIERQLNKVAKG